MSTVDKYYNIFIYCVETPKMGNLSVRLICHVQKRINQCHSIEYQHTVKRRGDKKKKKTDQLGDINVMMHLQILKTNMNRRVRQC